MAFFSFWRGIATDTLWNDRQMLESPRIKTMREDFLCCAETTAKVISKALLRGLNLQQHFTYHLSLLQADENEIFCPNVLKQVDTTTIAFLRNVRSRFFTSMSWVKDHDGESQAWPAKHKKQKGCSALKNNLLGTQFHLKWITMASLAAMLLISCCNYSRRLIDGISPFSRQDSFRSPRLTYPCDEERSNHLHFKSFDDDSFKRKRLQIIYLIRRKGH